MDAKKKGRVDKQKKQELQNFGRQQKAQGMKPNTNAMNPQKKQRLNNNTARGRGESEAAPNPRELKRNQLDHAAQIAAKSTISMGKFDKKLKGEKPVKEKQKAFTPGKEKSE